MQKKKKRKKQNQIRSVHPPSDTKKKIPQNQNTVS